MDNRIRQPVNTAAAKDLSMTRFSPEHRVSIFPKAYYKISVTEKTMSTILLIVLLLLLIGALPAWPYSRAWGYYPSGGLGLIMVVLLVLVLAGRL
jgi:hypothetical protein